MSSSYEVVGGFSMTNPYAIDDVDELRRELDRANQQLMTQMAEIASARRTAHMIHYLNSRLLRLVEAHLSGDASRLTRELSDLADHVVSRVH